MQQQYLAYQRQQALQVHQRAPRAALVQTGSQSRTESDSSRASALSARESALAARGKALAAREKALRNKAEKVRAEEVKEEQEEQSLAAREKALAAKEKQVQLFQGELVQEQRKIWKVLKATQRHAQSRGPETQAPAQQVQAAPQNPAAQVAQSVPAGSLQPTAVRPARVLVAAKNPSQQRPQAPIALAQMSSNAKYHAGHKKTVRRVRAKATAVRAKSAAVTQTVTGKSDLHVVMAANVPKEGEFAQATGDEEDDLEQVLLQQSSNVHNKGDPVESS